MMTRNGMLLAVGWSNANSRDHQTIDIICLRKRSEILGFFIDDELDLKKRITSWGRGGGNRGRTYSV